MIKESKAKSYTLFEPKPNQLAELVYDQICSVCDKYLENNSDVLKHSHVGNLICMSCAREIAEYIKIMEQ